MGTNVSPFDWATKRKAAWLPVYGVFLVLIITFLYYLMVGISLPNVSFPRLNWDSSSREAFASDVQWRLIWGVSAIAIWAVFAGSFALFWNVVCLSSSGSQSKMKRSLLKGAPCSLAAIYLILWLCHVNVADIIGSNLLGQLRLRAWSIELLASVSNILAALAIGWYAAALYSILNQAADDFGADEQRCDRLAQRFSLLTNCLYWGAALLVSGTIEIWALYSWPSALLSQEEAKSVTKIATALSTAAGAIFTLILLAGFGSTAFVLKLRAYDLARQLKGREQPDESTQRFLRRKGLTFSLAALPHIFAILAPIIAGGPLAAVMKSFTK